MNWRIVRSRVGCHVVCRACCPESADAACAIVLRRWFQHGRCRRRRRRCGGRGGHFGSRRGSQADLPATSQSSVHLDQPECDFASCLSPEILLLNQVLLDDGILIEIDGSDPELFADCPNGRLRSDGTLIEQLSAPPLGPQERDHSIFDFGTGRKDGLLVRGNQFLQCCVLEANVVDQPAIVQDVPLKRWSHTFRQRAT